MADKPEDQKKHSHLVRIITGSYNATYQEILEILAVAVMIVHIIMITLEIYMIWTSICYLYMRQGLMQIIKLKSLIILKEW